MFRVTSFRTSLLVQWWRLCTSTVGGGRFDPWSRKFHGLPRWCSGKEYACQHRAPKRHRFNPWVGKIPWSRKWQPMPVFLPGKFHGQRSLVGPIRGVTKSQTRGSVHTHAHGEVPHAAHSGKEKNSASFLGVGFHSPFLCGGNSPCSTLLWLLVYRWIYSGWNPLPCFPQ